jgi:hypothetical protein
MMLTGGKLSESMNPARSNCEVFIKDSVAIALVKPVDGNPSTRYPSSMVIGLVSFILILGKNPINHVISECIIVFVTNHRLSFESSAEYKNGSIVVASACNVVCFALWVTFPHEIASFTRAPLELPSNS